MESIFDLPTHVLSVHAPVVLQPLLAFVTVIVVARQRWRRRFGWWLVGALVVVVVSVFVAMRTGEAFDDLLDGLVDVGKHQSLAETTRNLLLVWLVALVALLLIDRRDGRRAGGRDGDEVESGAESPVPDRGAATTRVITSGLVVLVAVLAALSTVWMVRTGHEGARVTWSGVIEQQRG